MKNPMPGYIIIKVLPTKDSFIDFVPRNNSGTLREVWVLLFDGSVKTKIADFLQATSFETETVKKCQNYTRIFPSDKIDTRVFPYHSSCHSLRIKPFIILPMSTNLARIHMIVI